MDTTAPIDHLSTCAGVGRFCMGVRLSGRGAGIGVTGWLRRWRVSIPTF